MEWQATWTEPLAQFVSAFGDLFGDRRSAVTFAEIVRGVIGAGSLICEQIAAHSLVLMASRHGAQGVTRFAGGRARYVRLWMQST